MMIHTIIYRNEHVGEFYSIWG